MFIALFIVWLLGLSLGSFVNVCAYRIPQGLSILSPGSYCTSCRRALPWRDLVPVLSFLIAGGRCRNCSVVISTRYPVTELLVATIAVGLYLVEGASTHFLYDLTFVLLMVLIAHIDWQHLIIPNSIVAVGVLLGLVLNITLQSTAAASRITSSIGGFGMALCILLLGGWLFKKQVLGFGDVKLSGLIALFLGFQDYLFSFWLAAVVGSIFGMTLKLVRNSRERREPGLHRGPRDGFPAHVQSSSIPRMTEKGSLRKGRGEKWEFFGDSSPELRLPFGSYLALTSSIVLVFSHAIDHFISLWLTWMQ